MLRRENITSRKVSYHMKRGRYFLDPRDIQCRLGNVPDGIDPVVAIRQDPCVHSKDLPLPIIVINVITITIFLLSQP